MEYYRHEIRAGAMVVGAGLILILMLFFSADLSFWFQATKLIHVTFKNVSGLAKYDPVVFKGVKVGKVSEMRVISGVDGIVEVSLEIDADLPLQKAVKNGPRGSQFQIISTGLLGESAVEIVSGDARAPELESGAVVAGREVVRIEELANMVQQIATNVRDAMDVITAAVNNPETQDKFRVILDNLANSSTNLDQAITGNMGNVNDLIFNLSRTSRDLKETSANLKLLSSDLSQTMSQNRDDIDLLIDNYKRLPIQVGEDMNRVQTSITSLVEENRAEINRAVKNLEATSKHIEELAEEIKKHPYRIIRKP